MMYNFLAVFEVLSPSIVACLVGLYLFSKEYRVSSLGSGYPFVLCYRVSLLRYCVVLPLRSYLSLFITRNGCK